MDRQIEKDKTIDHGPYICCVTLSFFSALTVKYSLSASAYGFLPIVYDNVQRMLKDAQAMNAIGQESMRTANREAATTMIHNNKHTNTQGFELKKKKNKHKKKWATATSPTQRHLQTHARAHAHNSHTHTHTHTLQTRKR
jgi:hypothetical protein